MGHLPIAIIKLDGSGNIAFGMERQQAFDASGWRIEKNELDIARAILDDHPEGCASASGWRRLVACDTCLDDQRLANRRLIDRRRELAVDRACRQMK